MIYVVNILCIGVILCIINNIVLIYAIIGTSSTNNYIRLLKYYKSLMLLKYK